MGFDPISLGIEALAGPALLEGGSKGAEAALGAGAAGLGGAAADAGAIALPEILVSGAAPAAFGAGDAAAGIGLGAGIGGAADAAAGGLGNLFGIGSAQAGGAGVPSPNDLVASGFDALNTGIADGTVQPSGGTTPNSFAAPDQITPTPIQTTSYSPSNPIGGPSGGAAGLANPADVGASQTVGPAAGTSVPPTTPPSSGGIGDLLSKLGTNTETALTKPGNLLSAALAAPLLKQLISPPKIPQQQNLQNLQGVESQFAAQQNQLGKTLTDPLTTGKLPEGAEQAVSNAIQDAITSTKARYANLGLSGSTAEQDAINNIQNQGTAQRFQIAEQMAQTGLNATSQAASTFGLQDQVFTALMNAQVQQDTSLQQALARFAGAAAGSGNNINLKLGA